MRMRIWLICLMVMTWLAACGPAAPVQTPEIPGENDSTQTPELPNETPPAPATGTVTEDASAAPTHTPPPLPEGYPAQPAPPPASAASGYPAQPLTAPAVDSYPAGEAVGDELVWVIRPLGEQCAEPDQNGYTDLREAVAALTAAGLTVGEAEMTNLIVCSACGCPTSAHFRIQVDVSDVAAAESLGWEQE